MGTINNRQRKKLEKAIKKLDNVDGYYWQRVSNAVDRILGEIEKTLEICTEIDDDINY